MRLRTDDDIYRARLVYLGPPGYTLPVQLPYAQYGMFILLVPFYLVIRYGVVAREEAYLELKFGDVYRAYKARVRRWL